MRVILCCLFVLFSWQTYPCFAGMVELRNSYYKATTNEDDSKQFTQLIEHLNVTNEPLLLGYKGVALMISAKYLFNPYSKWHTFKKGMNTLEAAIHADTANIELRFLRYGIQTNIPALLFYFQNKEEDKKCLLNNYAQINDKDLKQRIYQYLIHYGNCNCRELALLNR
jgi:hypothetical protein